MRLVEKFDPRSSNTKPSRGEVIPQLPDSYKSGIGGKEASMRDLNEGLKNAAGGKEDGKEQGKRRSFFSFFGFGKK